MDKDNKSKIKLSTLVILFILIVIIIGGIIFVVLNNNNSNTVLEGKTTQQPEKTQENTQVEPQPDPQTESPTPNQYADTDFSFKFLKMENKKENMLYSPLSIKYALKMLNDGANGNTKTQIENVIGNTDLVKYNNINDILSLANSLYIRDTYSPYVKDEYKNKLINDYNAEIKYDSFQNANNINNWIKDKTFGQIPNILQDALVQNPDNEMFLINALAIDMAWKNKFDEKDTHGDAFYLTDGTEMTATTMTQETKSDNISYFKDNNITAISMDLEQYENTQMEFIAIMPNNDLASYVENFDTDTLKNITNNLTSASKPKNGLNISVPKFSFDYDLNLQEDLKNLGITDAFDANLADLSNMSTRKPFWVGGALHKANIDFTEKGVKAAAATIIYMTDGMLIDEAKPIEIKIDKPFLYLVRDKKTNEIWFVGTVYTPNSWENDKANYVYR